MTSPLAHRLTAAAALAILAIGAPAIAQTKPPTTAHMQGDEQAWINDPQQIKPGCLMPSMKLAGKELDQLVSYLETLK